MKVWILIGQNFGHYEEFGNDPGHVLGVYDAEHKAKEEEERRSSTGTKCDTVTFDYYDIEEHEVK